MTFTKLIGDITMNIYEDTRNYLCDYLYDLVVWAVEDWRFRFDNRTKELFFNLTYEPVPIDVGAKAIYIPCMRKGVNLRVNTLTDDIYYE